MLDAACHFTDAHAGIIGLHDPAMLTSAVHPSTQAHTAPMDMRGEGLDAHILAAGVAYRGRYGDLPNSSVVAIREHAVRGLPILLNQQMLGVSASGWSRRARLGQRRSHC